jgi:SAM-dependent methyltransferase
MSLMPENIKNDEAAPFDPYDDPALYDAQTAHVREDLPFWEECAIKNEWRSVLELGCGTGRIGLHLLSSTFAEYYGLDASESFLETFRRKLPAKGKIPNLLNSSFTDFDLGGLRFDAILLPFNALHHVYDVEQWKGLTSCVKKHLMPGGWFCIDVFQPDPSRLFKRKSDDWSSLYQFETQHLGPLDLFESTRYDALTQINTVRWCLRKKDGEILRMNLRQRVYWPAELEYLLALSGFSIKDRYGDYSFGELQEESPKVILMCQGVQRAT